jgi:hypothetical protein
MKLVDIDFGRLDVGMTSYKTYFADKMGLFLNKKNHWPFYFVFGNIFSPFLHLLFLFFAILGFSFLRCTIRSIFFYTWEIFQIGHQYLFEGQVPNRSKGYIKGRIFESVHSLFCNFEPATSLKKKKYT